MITIWNRREVYVGSSLQQFSELRNRLDSKRIKYQYKLVNHEGWYGTGSRHGVIGSLGENSELNNIYYIYVHKDDYDKALSEIHDMKK